MQQEGCFNKSGLILPGKLNCLFLHYVFNIHLLYNISDHSALRKMKKYAAILEIAEEFTCFACGEDYPTLSSILSKLHTALQQLDGIDTSANVAALFTIRLAEELRF